MHDFILEVVNQYGYIGIFALITIENLFPPIPSELILTFGGFLTTVTTMKVWGVVVSSTLGSVFGAVILYSVGRLVSVKTLERIFDSKYAKIVHLRKSDVRRAGHWFVKHGNLAVFLGRFVPVIRSLVSIPAGIAKMKLGPFLALTFLGTSIWNLVLVYLGKMAGDAWESVNRYMDIYFLISIVILAALGAYIAARFIRSRFLVRQNLPEAEGEEGQGEE